MGLLKNNHERFNSTTKIIKTKYNNKFVENNYNLSQSLTLDEKDKVKHYIK